MEFSATTEYALSVAREAADLVMRILPEPAAAKDIKHKGPTDLVTRADHEAERLIVERIRERFPDHALLAEEGTSFSGAGPRWLIDPVDGTANFARGIPWFAISIAFEEGGIVTSGVVAVPPLSEYFVGERGRGAYLIAGSAAPVKLAVSAVSDLGLAQVSTGLPPEPRRSRHVPTIPPVMLRTQEVRIMGAAAGHLAYVAAGRLDAFWEPGLNPWDVAAGILLVEEAGGRVTDLAGRPIRAPGGDVLATNGVLHAALLDAIGR
ncbi:MAG: inositol monophosphatase family protein [bacterium]